MVTLSLRFWVSGLEFKVPAPFQPVGMHVKVDEMLGLMFFEKITKKKWQDIQLQ